jgi:tetratricopeptide (TPR) repeat protein
MTATTKTVMICAMAFACITSSAAQKSTPQPDPAQLRRCVELLGRGDFEQARSLAQSLVDAFPKSGRPRLLLALSYHKQRRYQEADPIFKRARELDPRDTAALAYHGWCLYYLGRSDEARAAFTAFLTTNPNYGDAHFALGLIAFDNDDLPQADERFRRAIDFAQRTRQRRDEAKARARLSDVLVRKGEFDQARRELEHAVKLNPDLYGAYFKLSRVLQRLGDKEGAKRARKMHDEVRQRVRPSKGHPE